jgi:methionyl-tRNA formyltransferase
MSDPDFVAALDDAAPDLAVVAAYGRLLPDRLLELPRFGMINVHASLLPKYRGAAPIHRAIMAGETETGITIIRLVHEMDAGPMLSSRSLAIEPADTSVALERRLAQLGADLLLESVDDIAAGRSTESPQDHERATFAPKITRDDGVIDWGGTAIAIHNQVRGLHPWPHAFSYVGGRRLLLLRTEPVPHALDEASPSEPVAGEILTAQGDRLIVAAGDHTSLAIHELQPEGRRALGTREFLAGHRLVPGARFQQSPS